MGKSVFGPVSHCNTEVATTPQSLHSPAWFLIEWIVRHVYSAVCTVLDKNLQAIYIMHWGLKMGDGGHRFNRGPTPKSCLGASNMLIQLHYWIKAVVLKMVVKQLERMKTDSVSLISKWTVMFMMTWEAILPCCVGQRWTPVWPHTNSTAEYGRVLLRYVHTVEWFLCCVYSIMICSKYCMRVFK